MQHCVFDSYLSSFLFCLAKLPSRMIFMGIPSGVTNTNRWTSASPFPPRKSGCSSGLSFFIASALWLTKNCIWKNHFGHACVLCPASCYLLGPRSLVLLPHYLPSFFFDSAFPFFVFCFLHVALFRSAALTSAFPPSTGLCWRKGSWY